MNKERLEDAILMMEEIVARGMHEEASFDMTSFIATGVVTPEHNCGTTACFAGHLALRHPGQFELDRNGIWFRANSALHRRYEGRKLGATHTLSVYLDCDHRTAGALILGLPGERINHISSQMQLERLVLLQKPGGEKALQQANSHWDVRKALQS